MVTMTVEWAAERADTPPRPPILNLANAVRLREVTEPSNLELSGDGKTYVYRAKGQLVYGFMDASAVDFSFPLPPWIADVSQELLLYTAAAVPSDPDILGIGFGNAPVAD
jgi:hypothetical protein